MPLLLSHDSHSQSAAAKAATARLAHAAVLERDRGEETGGADAEAYTDRAYPGDEIGIAQIQGALAANDKIKKRGAKVSKKWDFIGPDTLNVDRLGTQSFIKPTQWSGRVTALAVDPKCKPQACTLYVGAAGGGLWRSTNALASNPSWQQISDGIPTNAIGSIAVDPNDATGKTIYVGTGEGNASGDSEAGLGLYKTTDGGAHWARVEGSFPVANNRSITWVAIEKGEREPHPARHALGRARHRLERDQCRHRSGAVAPGRRLQLDRRRRDLRAHCRRLVQRGQVRPERSEHRLRSAGCGRPDQVDDRWLGRQLADDLLRQPWPLLVLAGAPPERQDTHLPLRCERRRSPSGAQVYRTDDAGQPAATMTASSNAAWTRLSNPAEGTPGFAVYNYCNTPLVGSQCTYDMFTVSPADRPDMVVVGGLMHYEELKPYAAPGGMRGNGRAVLMSQDAGATWTDVTGDVGGESMHPDQHAAVFVPGNPDQFFVGSDGGVIRTSGSWADASSQCDSRGLSAAFLTDCHNWLKQIPTELRVINAGLATLQMTAIAVSPFTPDNEALAGTQDNGTLAYSGKPTWILPLTGDGGDPGYDAVDPNLHFHTYTGGQMDVNYNGNDPTSWLWIGDRFIVNFPESIRFYAPAIPDPNVTKTIFVGAQRIWRTQDAGGDRAFLEAHCNTAVGEFPSDLLYTGACGSPNDWSPLGASTLTGAAFGATKSGNNLSALSRSQDGGTMWAGTGTGRVFISRNVNAAAASVTFTRIDGATQPNRAVSSIYADPTNANHAIVTFSGFDAVTPATPGHVFDVVVDPVTNAATWTDISFDIGDQPVNDVVLDVASGDLYAATDYGVLRLAAGSQTWLPAADGMPTVTVSGLTLAAGKHDDRLLYAATHGRSAYRLRLK